MGTEKSITDCKIEPIENCASLHGAAVVCENKLQLKGDFYVIGVLIVINYQVYMSFYNKGLSAISRNKLNFSKEGNLSPCQQSE